MTTINSNQQQVLPPTFAVLFSRITITMYSQDVVGDLTIKFRVHLK